MELRNTHDGFDIQHNGEVLFAHRSQSPSFFVGTGHDTIEMYRGNFDIQDYLESRLPLKEVKVSQSGQTIVLEYRVSDQAPVLLVVEASLHADELTLKFASKDPSINRLWVRIPAQQDEKVWGCGEQMSYLNLRGRHFPLWTSEPGVGRDKTTEMTFKSDVTGKAGGDYYHTNYPQPTFLSSRHYSCHVDTTAYADFDFQHPAFHELQIWAIPEQIQIKTAPTFLGLVEKLSLQFGRQPKLPDWIYNGLILGLKGGGDNTFSRMENALAHGIRLSAVWSEDWAGIRQTSFGKRLFWNWKWNTTRYPQLDQKIKALRDRGIRFMTYATPHLCEDGDLFPLAKENGVFAKNNDGEVALVEFGEFKCGIVDLTKPEACQWFKDVIIKGNMLDLGISGWMADFGEYLPTEDVQLANGVDAKLMHNAWPTLWAKLNAEAVAEAGKTDDTVFFMRAGYTGIQRYCPLLWAGDQCVDFSRHDGMNTVITGALSSGLMGNAYHHSDIGGFTSLFGNRRTKEVFERWADMAAFTPVMRTHESNRPDENFQFDHDAQTMAHLAKMTRVYCHLAPYLKLLGEEAAEKGYPVQRPLFLHYETDRVTYDIQDEYLYGADLLVAPVCQSNVSEWRVYLPHEEDWIHVWSGRMYRGGQYVTVDAPVGQPPVFYRSTTAHQALFEGLRHL
jgi:alpha-glucosidase